MNKFREVIGRTLFWSYDRGTWPYDVMVIAIVLFVFLSPRNWFNDRPAAGGLTSETSIELVKEDVTTGIKIYRVQANFLSQPKPDPAMVKKAQEFLRKNVPELQGTTFEIRNIIAGQDDDGTIVYYDISVKK